MAVMLMLKSFCRILSFIVLALLIAYASEILSAVSPFYI